MADKKKCERCGKMVPWVCFLGNSTLATFKITIGFLADSKALIADGMHSASDVIATIMVLISLNISGRDDDDSHPWGHGKIEFLGAAFVYTILFLLSLFLLYDSIGALIRGDAVQPEFISLIGAAISIIANYILSSYGLCAGKKLSSPALIANAQENRADMLSSIAVLIGIALSLCGYPFFDALAALLVALIILRTATRLGLDAIRNLIDSSLPTNKLLLIKGVVREFKQVRNARFRTRRVGQQVWVEMEIQVSPEHSVTEAAAIASEVRLALIRRFRHIKEVSISFTC
ncbi:MAG: cation transporter [Planctomycetes bacterium]|nr:cation transporter [Planctomycetota bacterium]